VYIVLACCLHWLPTTSTSNASLTNAYSQETKHTKHELPYCMNKLSYIAIINLFKLRKQKIRPYKVLKSQRIHRIFKIARSTTGMQRGANADSLASASSSLRQRPRPQNSVHRRPSVYAKLYSRII